jgi:hypothetical protein
MRAARGSIPPPKKKKKKEKTKSLQFHQLGYSFEILGIKLNLIL